MKRCPECRRDYYDDSLLYCLDDGTALLDGPSGRSEPPAPVGGQFDNEPATAILPDLPTNHAPGTHLQVNEADVTAATQTDRPPDTTASTRPGRKGLVVGLAVIALAAFGLAFAVYRYYSGTRNIPFKSIKIEKLTNIGNATVAQISPDGQYVAHAVYERGKYSLRVWHVSTKSSVEIVPPAD